MDWRDVFSAIIAIFLHGILFTCVVYEGFTPHLPAKHASEDINGMEDGMISGGLQKEMTFCMICSVEMSN